MHLILTIGMFSLSYKLYMCVNITNELTWGVWLGRNETKKKKRKKKNGYCCCVWCRGKKLQLMFLNATSLPAEIHDHETCMA